LKISILYNENVIEYILTTEVILNNINKEKT
jgi:hypothetical protein